MAENTTIEEVIAIGRRRDERDHSGGGGGDGGNRNDGGNFGGGGGDLSGLPAFPLFPVVPPPVVRPPPVLRLVPTSRPPPIPEIIVTGTRIPPTAGFFGGLFAIVGGITIAKILDDISQANLDRSLAELLAEGRFRPTETPLETIQPETIPEIITTAPRPLVERLPAPSFFVGDVFEFTADPVLDPPPAPLPDFIGDPVAPPDPPAEVQPTSDPTPFVNPFTDPFADPFGSPLGDPFLDPIADPFADPIGDPIGTPLSPPGSPRLTVPQQPVLPSSQPEPLPQTQAGRCPPCPKKKKKKKEVRRTQCYKKIVFERSFARWDREVEWAQLDCETGREL